MAETFHNENFEGTAFKNDDSFFKFQVKIPKYDIFCEKLKDQKFFSLRDTLCELTFTQFFISNKCYYSYFSCYPVINEKLFFQNNFYFPVSTEIKAKLPLYYTKQRKWKIKKVLSSKRIWRLEVSIVWVFFCVYHYFSYQQFPFFPAIFYDRTEVVSEQNP